MQKLGSLLLMTGTVIVTVAIMMTGSCSTGSASGGSPPPPPPPPPPQSGSGYQTVLNNGSPQPQRSTLNLVSAGRAIADDSGGSTRVRVDDPATMAFIKEEFLSGRICAAIQNNGSLGELGWNCDGLQMLFAPAMSGRPGLVRGLTGGTANAFGRLAMGTPPSLIAAENFDVLWMLRPVDADSDTRFRVGISGDFSIDQSADGAYFEKLPNDGTWFCVCRAGGSEARMNTSVSVTAGTWYKMRIRRVDASTVGFTLNGGSEILLSSNCPSAAAVQVGTQIKNIAPVAKGMDFDYAHLLITGLNR